jgi:hypothetical protein
LALLALLALFWRIARKAPIAPTNALIIRDQPKTAQIGPDWPGTVGNGQRLTPAKMRSQSEVRAKSERSQSEAGSLCKNAETGQKVGRVLTTRPTKKAPAGGGSGERIGTVVFG